MNNERIKEFKQARSNIMSCACKCIAIKNADKAPFFKALDITTLIRENKYLSYYEFDDTAINISYYNNYVIEAIDYLNNTINGYTNVIEKYENEIQ